MTGWFAFAILAGFIAGFGTAIAIGCWWSRRTTGLANKFKTN